MRNAYRSPPSAVVVQFVKEWTTEYPRYEILAEETRKICLNGLNPQAFDSKLSDQSVKCLITNRAKSATTIQDSIRRREEDRKTFKDPKTGDVHGLGPFTSSEEIRQAMPDLAGIRIILTFPDDVEKVEAFVKETFNIRAKVHWGVDEEGDLKVEHFKDPKNRFVGYRATHYRVQLNNPINTRRNSLPSGWWKDKDVEIQVTSMTMYAWQEVHHDLIYKTHSGELTDDEKRTLDMVNGMVHANEIALNQFHQSINRRLEEERTKFRDISHLENWLTLFARKSFHESYKTTSPQIKYSEILLRVLQLYSLDTPEKLLEVFTDLQDQSNEDPLALLRDWRYKLEERLRRGPGRWEREDDVSAWALFRLCEQKTDQQMMNSENNADQKEYIVIEQLMMN